MKGGHLPEQDESEQREGVEPITIRAVVEEYDHAPDECTFYPEAVPELDDLLTIWITAEEGSYVDRREHR